MIGDKNMRTLSRFVFNLPLFCSTISNRIPAVNFRHHRLRTMESIQTNRAPQAIGPYSQAIKANGLVFASGQIPLDPETMQLIEGDIRAQTERVLTNLQMVLEAAGTSLRKVVK